MTQSRLLTTLYKKSFENIVGGKGENAAYQHFLLFPHVFYPSRNSPLPTMFSTLPETNFNLLVTIILSSANPFNLDPSKILSFDKQLIVARNVFSLNKAKMLSLVFFLPKFWTGPN